MSATKDQRKRDLAFQKQLEYQQELSESAASKKKSTNKAAKKNGGGGGTSSMTFVTQSVEEDEGAEVVESGNGGVGSGGSGERKVEEMWVKEMWERVGKNAEKEGGERKVLVRRLAGFEQLDRASRPQRHDERRLRRIVRLALVTLCLLLYSRYDTIACLN